MRRFLWHLFVNVGCLGLTLTLLTVAIVAAIEVLVKYGVIQR